MVWRFCPRMDVSDSHALPVACTPNAWQLGGTQTLCPLCGFSFAAHLLLVYKATVCLDRGVPAYMCRRSIATAVQRRLRWTKRHESHSQKRWRLNRGLVRFGRWSTADAGDLPGHAHGSECSTVFLTVGLGWPERLAYDEAFMFRQLILCPA